MWHTHTSVQTIQTKYGDTAVIIVVMIYCDRSMGGTTLIREKKAGLAGYPGRDKMTAYLAPTGPLFIFLR